MEKLQYIKVQGRQGTMKWPFYWLMSDESYSSCCFKFLLNSFNLTCNGIPTKDDPLCRQSPYKIPMKEAANAKGLC